MSTMHAEWTCTVCSTLHESTTARAVETFTTRGFCCLGRKGCANVARGGSATIVPRVARGGHRFCEADGCPKAASFGTPGGGRRWCKDHKEAGAECLASRGCEADGCPKMASFGTPGGGKRWCKDHKERRRFCMCVCRYRYYARGLLLPCALLATKACTKGLVLCFLKDVPAQFGCTVCNHFEQSRTMALKRAPRQYLRWDSVWEISKCVAIVRHRIGPHIGYGRHPEPELGFLAQNVDDVARLTMLLKRKRFGKQHVT